MQSLIIQALFVNSKIFKHREIDAEELLLDKKLNTLLYHSMILEMSILAN